MTTIAPTLGADKSKYTVVNSLSLYVRSYSVSRPWKVKIHTIKLYECTRKTKHRGKSIRVSKAEKLNLKIIIHGIKRFKKKNTHRIKRK